MHELEHLKSMWGAKAKRSVKLIVPEVTYKNNNNSLNNGHWLFKVSYAFRDALDIKYEQRKKDRKAYMLWTQGPIIHFKEGDFIHSHCGTKAVQVKFSDRMGWDKDKEEMYEGKVTYKNLKVDGNKYTNLGEIFSTQMEFLSILIGHSKN